MQISCSKELSIFCNEVCAECGEQKGIGQDGRMYVTKKVAAMCSKKFNSILRAKDKESMPIFKFGTVMSEL